MSTSPNNPAPVAVKATEAEAWVFWRLPLFLFWWAMAAGVINNLTGEELVRSSWFCFGLPIVALVVILWQHKKEGWVAYIALPIWFVLYWLLFPIVAPAQGIIWLPTGLPRVKKLCKYLVWSLHLIFALAYVPLLLLSWYVLWFSQHCEVITYTVYLEVILNTVLLLVAMRWAADPMYPFLQFVDFLLGLQKWWDKRTLFHPSNQPTDDKKKSMAQTAANALGQYEKMVGSFNNFVHWLERRSIVAVFVGVLVSLFVFTVLGYGACMYSMQRLQCLPPHYIELDANSYQCCIYSLSVLTTAPLTNIIPSTILAKSLYGMELISTFLIATVFFGMFSAAKGFHGKERFKEYKKKSDKVFDWITAVKQKHSAILNPPALPQLPYRPLPPPPAAPSPAPPPT